MSGRNFRYLFSRREFLRGMAVAGLGASLPSFLVRGAMAAQAQGQLLAGKDQRVLVVVQLGGGNDALNTTIPFEDDLYFSLRQRLAIPQKEVLRLNDLCGFHPSLAPLKALHDDGLLATIQCIGYPNPNRSHFRSMEIWHTATDADQFSSTGWLGRYFDNACSGADDPAIGVNVGFEAPQAFTGERRLGVSFDRPEQFQWRHIPGAEPELFAALNQLDPQGDPAVSTLDFLRHTTANAVASSEKIIRAAGARRQPDGYPNTALGGSLRTIATMIAGGLPTRVYYASQGGYDTHAFQEGRHATLLGEFSTAMKAFQDDLKALGLQDQVLTLCFSEFGRRAAENASRGTDHGGAGTAFLVGPGAVAGVHGGQPDLKNLINGDYTHRVDFRGVYGEILQSWLDSQPEHVLGRPFSPIGVVRA